MKTTLYKKDSKGNIRELNYWVEGADFCQSSGILDGKLVENKKTCKGKNIGKTNETTPEEQAVLEMNSKIREKLQEDYFKTIAEAENIEVILPMLAKSYKDHSSKIDWTDTFVQPKLDGMRCLAIIKEGNVQLFSRDGINLQEKHGSLQHIISELETRFVDKTITLDGELYIHGTTFQEVMKKIKKYREGDSELVQYHIYDQVSDKKFYTRKRELELHLFGSNVLIDVRTISIDKIKYIKQYHEEFLSQGYEGTMVRWGTEGYKVNGRSEHLLKYKDFHDLDAKIIDIVPAENRPEWGLVVCEYNGKQFRATPKMPHEDKIQMLKDKNNYIGETAIITYFEFTDDGIPRFPIYKGIRLDNQQ